MISSNCSLNRFLVPYSNEYIPERPKGGGHLAAMNCVGKLQRDLHQCCGILVKPLSAFFGYLPFDFIFKFLLMAFFSHDLGQLSHPFLLSLPVAIQIILSSNSLLESWLIWSSSWLSLSLSILSSNVWAIFHPL